jgi:hypothetical protein
MGLAPSSAIQWSKSFQVYRPEAILGGSAGSFFLSIRTKVFFMVRFEVLDGVRQCRLKIVNIQPPLLPDFAGSVENFQCGLPWAVSYRATSYSRPARQATSLTTTTRLGHRPS